MLGNSLEPVLRPAIPQARSAGPSAISFIPAPRFIQSSAPLASSSLAGSSTPYSTSFSAARAVISGSCSSVVGPASANLEDNSRWNTVRSDTRRHSFNRVFGGRPLNVAATGAAGEQEAIYVGMSAPDVGAGTAAPAAAAKSLGGRKLPDFPPVSMDPDATQKFAEIVVRCGKVMFTSKCTSKGVFNDDYKRRISSSRLLETRAYSLYLVFWTLS